VRGQATASAPTGADAGEQALAAALIELLASSPPAMARLVELLDDHRRVEREPIAPVYTVASLAALLNVRQR